MVAPYKRRESVVSADQAMALLAKAVITQWYYDGKPEADRKMIEYWFNIYQESKSYCDVQTEFTIGDAE